LRLFSFGGYGLALVVFGAYDSYPAIPPMWEKLTPVAALDIALVVHETHNHEG